MKQKKKHRINIAPCEGTCVRADMAHIKHAVWSGYNHESKGLKKEQMDLQELENPFSLSFFLGKKKENTAFVHCIVASKVSSRCSVRSLFPFVVSR